jgi:hypothetical protein
MKRLESFQIAAVLLACILFPPAASPQEVPAPQDNTAKPLSKKEARKREQKLSKELGPAFGDWLRNEVPDIITDEERARLPRAIHQRRARTSHRNLLEQTQPSSRIP